MTITQDAGRRSLRFLNSTRFLSQSTQEDTCGGLERMVIFVQGLTGEHMGNVHVCVLK